jgi:hypothetical protein
MKNFRLSFLVLKMVVLLSLVANAFALDKSWEQIDDSDGIKVWRKDIEGSPVKAFRGEITLDASVSKISWVLADNKHRKDWVDRLETVVGLEKKSADKAVVYQSFDLPFPISDRDMVIQGSFVIDNKAQKVYLNLKSVEHPKAPETVGVRAQLHHSKYVLTPVNGGKQTKVEVEILTDPKGLLPKWLVNIIQKKWPYKTLMGLKNQVNKPFVKDYKYVSKRFRVRR